MIYMFDTRHADGKTIFIQAPSPAKDVDIPVYSIKTGVTKYFRFDEEATHQYALDREFWDGEEAHYLLRCVDNPEITLEVYNTPYNHLEDFEGDTYANCQCVGCGAPVVVTDLVTPDVPVCDRCDARDRADIAWHEEKSANTHS